MRTTNINSYGYVPNSPPSDSKDIGVYVYNELVRIAGVLSLVAAGHLDKSYAAPSKPRDGDVRYADGTSWNPGSGAGIYYYNGSAWVKL